MSIEEPLKAWFPLSRAIFAFHMGGFKLPDGLMWQSYDYSAFPMATGAVWDSMLYNFNRAVRLGEIVLYARPKTVLAGFDRIPRDVWPALTVVDWHLGIAKAPDGTGFFLIHAGARVASPEPPAAVPLEVPNEALKKEGKKEQILAAMRLMGWETVDKIKSTALEETFVSFGNPKRSTCENAKELLRKELKHEGLDIPAKPKRFRG
jgi:hypothetical protein